MRKAVIASTVGTTIEWYDFLLYSVVTGLVFGKLFFPHSDPLIGVLEGLRGLFCRLYRPPDRRRDLRPLRRPDRAQGGIDRDAVDHRPCDLRRRLRPGLRFNRHLGRGDPDRHPLHPGHRRRRRVGRLGVARDGMGGTNKHRGFITSWPQFGGPAGLFLANMAVLVGSAISGDQFFVWGWRIPFMLSIIMVGIGLYIRLGILETPIFRRIVAEERVERVPVLEVLKRQSRQVILAALLRAPPSKPGLYLSRVHLRLRHTGAASVARLPADRALIAAGLFSFVSIPVAGASVGPFRPQAHLYHRLGLTGIFGFIYFAMLNSLVPALMFIGIVLSFVPHDIMYGPQAALIAECFTPRLRYSGASIGYQLASITAGGPAPLIATALLAAYGSGYVIAVYIAFCAVVSIVATLLLPDYTGRDISQEHA